MLIINIGLGILLAFMVIRFRREIIGLGIIGLIGVIALSLTLTVGYFIYENFELILVFLIPISSLVLIIWFFKTVGHKISIVTLDKLNLTFGEVAGILFTFGMLASGFIFIIRSIFINELNGSDINSGLGLGLFFTGLIGSIVHIINVRHAIGQRKIHGRNRE